MEKLILEFFFFRNHWKLQMAEPMAEKGSPPPPYGVDSGVTYPQPPPQYTGGYPAGPPPGTQPYPTQYPTTTTATVITTTSQGVAFSPTFGERPTNIKCPYCHEQVISRTEYVNGALAWIICASLAFAGLFLLIPWFFCCVPFCITSCQDVEHYCPSCNRLLGSYRRLR